MKNNNGHGKQGQHTQTKVGIIHNVVHLLQQPNPMSQQKAMLFFCVLYYLLHKSQVDYKQRCTLYVEGWMENQLTLYLPLNASLIGVLI